MPNKDVGNGEWVQVVPSQRLSGEEQAELRALFSELSKALASSPKAKERAFVLP